MKLVRRTPATTRGFAMLAITLGLLLLGASLAGALHHHSGGGTDSACALCSAGGITATATPAIAAPAAPGPRPETIAPRLENRHARVAAGRASSRAPPSA
jgi:hypothetical protein